MWAGPGTVSLVLHFEGHTMTVRVVVGIDTAQPWDSLRRSLYRDGVLHLSDPRPELPDAVVATLRHEATARDYIAAVQSLRGVRWAEPDGWVFTTD